MARALLLIIVALPLLASAQEADGGATGVLTKPPVLLKQVEAVFPPELVDAGVGGTVVMELDIGADGKVMDARVIQSAGAAFDEAALAAVRQFEFSPAEVDNAPAAVRIQYSYEFLFRPQVVNELQPTTDAGTAEPVVNFSGTVVERGTRNPLPRATVVIADQETETDERGRFEVRDVPPGSQRVIVSAPDHSNFEATETIEPGKRTEVTYFVRRSVYSAYETTVRGEREKKEVAQVTLKQEEIRLIPGTQGDAFKVVQNLPGVARPPFGIGLLVVRGGKPWDTRTYVDDAIIPLLFHFGGLNATFNANLLEDITFEPGNFSTEYGRSIGGLVRGKTRTPSKEGVHGYLDVNVIDTSFLVEAPINDDWSIAASGRRSYIDTVLPFVLHTFVPQANILNFTVGPRYYDYQLKLERKPKGGKSRFWIELFGSNDELKALLSNAAFDPEGRDDITTALFYNRLAANYEVRLNENWRSRSHLSIGWDRTDFSVGSDIFIKNTTFPLLARQTFEWRIPEWNLDTSFGFDGYFGVAPFEAQSPPRFRLNEIPDPFVSRRLAKSSGTVFGKEPGLFAEAVWQPLPKLKLVPGVRVDYESVMNDAWVDPRFAALYALTETTTLKGAIGRFHQPPDYRQGLLDKTFGNPDLLPEGANHYSVGVEHHFTDAISLDLQLYYKALFDQARQFVRPAAGSSNVDDLDLAYTSTGYGRSYGAELLVRHRLTKNFFGWVSYSLSRTERDYPQNGGKLGLNALDQPHNLVALASYKLPKDFIVGARIRYASGPLNTPIVGSIFDANGNYYFPLQGAPFSRRLPAFFQLDVRVDKRWVYEKWMLSVYADIQNVTNRQNVESVSYNYDFTQQQYFYGLPIIPDIGVRGEF
ncbi:MAG: TonB-dependent receptor domain-containing protein [Myxococcaceae bacterium]